MVVIRRFALLAPDGTYGYRVQLHAHGHDLLLARNLHQCISRAQALAMADAHITLLTNPADRVQIEGNPCDGLRLKDIEMRVHIETTEEGHAVSMGCFGPKNRNIVTYDSTTLETELSMVVGKMRHGVSMLATDLTNFGLAVPMDWTPNMKLFGTDDEFVRRLRESLSADEV